MNRKLIIYLIIVLSILLIISLGAIIFLLGKRSATIPKMAKVEEAPKIVKEMVITQQEAEKEAKESKVETKIKEKREPSKTISEIANEQGGATVFIATYSKIGIELGLGSGFIVSKDGDIVTNFHVIDNAYSASIKLTNGDVYDDVSVIDYDERRDIAILRIKGFNLPVANIGDSDETIIGEAVVAIGNPAGLENSISDGIISALRDMEGYKLFQITAPISAGSSGGPVYNIKGKVIGIATSTIQGAQNLNFAVPINYVKPLLKKEESIMLGEFQDNFQKKKWIGGKFDIAKTKPISQKEEDNVGYLGIFWDLTQPEGVLKIWGFRKYSPARDAGLKIGDEIIQEDDFIFKGKAPEEMRQFSRSKKEGDVSSFKILRDKEEREIKVTCGKKPKPTYVVEAIEVYLYLDKKIRLAIMLDEINIVGSSGPDAEKTEWKKSVRRGIINDEQQRLMSFFKDNNNFSIVDTGKIDVIINDLENQYGALPPQVRNNVLQSLGVTHLLEISYTRYCEQKYFEDFWRGGEWRDKLNDVKTDKLIELISEEVVCIDTTKIVKDYNDKEWQKPKYDPEDKELFDYFEEMSTLQKKKDLKK